MLTMAEQAVTGLEVAIADGVVRVRDGHDTWLCTRGEWDRAIGKLADMEADESDEGGAEAYTALCATVRAPIASIDGPCKGDFAALVRDAVDAGVIPEEAARSFGVTL
jgi:hypothetical protein